MDTPFIVIAQQPEWS